MSNRKAFEEELNELKVELVRMCRITEEMIINSIEALIKKDGQLAASVPPRDCEVDEFELDIERKCMRIYCVGSLLQMISGRFPPRLN